MSKTIILLKKKLHYKLRIYNRKSYLEPNSSIDTQILGILSGKTHHQIKLKPLGEVWP